MKTNRLKLKKKTMNNQVPNKHVMALVTFLLLLPLVYFIPELIAIYITTEKFLVSLISVSIIVPLLSYLFIPLVLKLFSNKNWVNKQKFLYIKMPHWALLVFLWVNLFLAIIMNNIYFLYVGSTVSNYHIFLLID